MLATAHPGSHSQHYPLVANDPLNINYDSDNDDDEDMQVDSDSDVKREDVDADGEFIEDEPPAVPLHTSVAGRPLSYYPRDSVRTLAPTETF